MASKKRARPTRRELKQKAVQYKGGKCELCGYNKCLAALTFHHVDPEKKDFNISSTLTSITWDKIKKELQKCQLLCSNCHSEIHASLFDGYVS